MHQSDSKNVDDDEKKSSLDLRKCIILDIDGTLIDTLIENDDSEYELKKSKLTRLDDIAIISQNNETNNELIDCEHIIYFRPYLIQFMKYLFSNKNIAHIAIWTASSPQWFDIVLKYCDPIGKYKEKYAFIWDSKRIAIKRAKLNEKNNNKWNKYDLFDCINDCTNYVGYHKPLSKVWRSKYLKQRLGFKRSNTIIIEDTPSNCVNNYGNAIYIKSFQCIIKQKKLKQHSTQHLCKDIETKKLNLKDCKNNFECEYNCYENVKDDHLYYLMKYLDCLIRVPNVRKIEKRDWYEKMKYNLD